MSVRVVARIRPLLKSELDKDTIVSADSPSREGSPTVVHIPNPKNEAEDFSFQFNSVYGAEATQKDLFEHEVAPTIKHLFNGFDVTLFAYGVTGTGKTHTMRGGKSLADRGVIPRLLSGIYRRSRKIEKETKGETQVDVSMSYYEIYNDKVFDLFEAPEKRTATGLSLRDNGGKTVVVGLTERPCESLKDFEGLYDQANVNRSTSATKLNAHSSRSHAILCVKVSVTSGEQVTVSTASAIDLAGSEDNRRTDNNKERLVESSSINKSLFVLAQCVEAISKKQSRIPYRESKMTRILSLGQNNGLTVMILNLAPVRSYHLDTLSSLNFANRTKKIEVREVENEPVFKGCSRPVSSFTGTSIKREPLRPLANAAHNATIRPSDPKDGKPNGKPPRAFSVYADKSRPSTGGQRMLKRSPPLKRPSDTSSTLLSRPSKVARPSQPQVSKNTIEDMIERKVTEILAAREIDRPAPTATNDISDEVKRRLEMLEQRIEGKEDVRSEGLTFLLMAKQHHARGEDASALKMYQLARDHFPENTKLEAKIAKLQQKLQGKKQAEQVPTPLPPAKPAVQPAARMPLKAPPPLPRRHRADPADDPDYQDGAASDDDNDGDSYSEDDAPSRPRAKPPEHRRKARVPSASFPEDDPAAPPTPCTEQLLEIINSRDAARIRALRGVGARRAESIVEALNASGATGEDGGIAVRTLGQLASFKGVGARTVEGMRLGLGTVVAGVMAGSSSDEF